MVAIKNKKKYPKIRIKNLMIKTNKKILAIIPARIGSKGLKKKNLRKIGKKSLVEYSVDIAKKSNYINKIAVSTDSSLIQKIAMQNNVWCKKLRPKKYATDKSSTHKAIKFVIDNIDYKPDLIIELHPTYIFRKFTTIDKAIEKLIKKRKSDSLISIRKIDDTSHPDFVINLSNDYINYKNSPIKFNRHYLKPKYRSLGYILISKIDSFNKTKSMLGNNCIGFEIRDDTEIIDINNLLDFKFASSVYNNQKKNNE